MICQHEPPAVKSILTPDERHLLEQCESEIKEKLESFVSVGTALATIRARKLYRATHSTFEAYCRTQFGMSKTHANRLIDATDVVENLTPIGVKSESQIRPLVNQSPEVQQAAWAEATKTTPTPTAKGVEAALRIVTKSPKREPCAVIELPEDHSEENASDNFWNLKLLWNKASLKDQSSFLKWLEENGFPVIEKAASATTQAA